MYIDLGGIAKGYGAWKAVEELKKHGIRSGLVAIAGDIMAFGLKQSDGVSDGGGEGSGRKNSGEDGGDGSASSGRDVQSGVKWKIGIRKPGAARDEILAAVNISDQAISTAGDYERFFIKDGKTYHHLLDPSTGHPAERCYNLIRSVTVVHDNGAMADGLDTALFVLGKDEAVKLITKLKLKAVLVYKDGSTYVSDSLKDDIEQ
ncbi:ApbE-like lipoprotein [Candidatus Magnetoovum chiemensis]|nr:ApbE-like lipoprotein [Candidatus Magnetoovum chiemensis]